MKTKVIFRKFPAHEGGDVIALFPAEGAQILRPDLCMSYQHIGQHGAAYVGIVQSTRLASPEEYAPLLRELKSIGYDLKIVKRFTRADYEKRKAEVCR